MPDLVTIIPVKDEDYQDVVALRATVPSRSWVIDDTVPCLVDMDSVDERGGWQPGPGSLGGSLLQGFGQAHDLRAGRVLVIDAGGSHDPHEAWTLLASDADVVVGSRFVPGASYDGSWWRSVGSRAYAVACNWLFDAHVTDWTSGYRVYSDKAIRVILADPPRCRRHAVQAEILGTCIVEGLTVAEVPIDYIGGESSFSWAAAREALRLWWRLAWDS